MLTSQCNTKAGYYADLIAKKSKGFKSEIENPEVAPNFRYSKVSDETNIKINRYLSSKAAHNMSDKSTTEKADMSSLFL